MHLSSPKIRFDDRLLSVEELFRRRNYRAGMKELEALRVDDFESSSHDLALYLLLEADRHFHRGSYPRAVESGLRAAQILADFPLNRRYARAQLILSKAYLALGDLKNAEIRARDSLAAYRRASDRAGQVDALNQLAGISYLRCRYRESVAFLEDALEMVDGDAHKRTQLTGNLGRTRIRTGQWDRAEQDLSEAIERNTEEHQEMSLAMNLLSLGYLQLRRRQFIMSRRSLDAALEVIARLDLKRERIIYAEYAGELAFARGDTFKAKAILSDAYERGMVLAPNSALVSQSARRLAEVELALDNLDEAMKYGQKALELALQLGEKVEIGLAQAVISEVFRAGGDHESAREHINAAIEQLREVGDPYELGRTLLRAADARMNAGTLEAPRLRAVLDEAHRLFRKLRLDYWRAETNFRSGMLACQHGNLARGFKKLSRAEKVFSNLKEKTRLQAVSAFLRTLSEQAVALSVSEENEFKIFGRIIAPEELSELNSNDLETLMGVLLQKTRADRAVIHVVENNTPSLITSAPFTEDQKRRFLAGFPKLLGEEIARSKPTLILDCRRDPFINELFADVPDPVCSVVVVPFRTADGTSGHLYIDRLAQDNRLNPFDQEQLNFAVGFADLVVFRWTALRKVQLEEDNRRLKDQLQRQAAFPNIVTQSADMLSILAQVRQVVDANISINIEGATGTGKDLLARAIHYNSSRRDKRFISVNCAALPESLLESELFGYKRGAFTGADRDKPGLFEEANGGTFFLDEIGDMPLSIQAKLLRLLETQELTRLGDVTVRKVDVRIVSATNRRLESLIEDGGFRQDLYYRMAGMTFRLPPLQERQEDIPLLVNHFLKDTGKTVSPELMKMLVAYEWPGNVRELENELKKMVLLSGQAEVIEPLCGSDRLKRSTTDTGKTQVAATLDQVAFAPEYSLYDYLAEHEKRFIIQALRRKRKVKKHAAALLNIPESTLRLKIKQYNIDLDSLSLD